MKILYLTVLQDDNIRSHFDNWYVDLAKYCDLDLRIRNIGTQTFWIWAEKTINKPETLPSLIRDTKKRCLSPTIKLEHVNQKYDWVITDFSYAFITEEWDKIKIPKAMIIEDSCNGLPEKQMAVAANANFDIVFCRYRQEFFKYQKKHLHKFHDIRWLPWSVNLDMFKDYGLEKKYDVTMSGYHFPPIYLFRDMALDELEDKEYFYELPHNGYIRNEDSVCGEDYAKFLNQCKISITGGLVYNRPVMKYYEIPASRCLLVSNWFKELQDLGFKDGENIVTYEYGNLDKQMRDLLADDAMRQEITDNGYNFVRKHHSGEVRAQQFLKELS